MWFLLALNLLSVLASLRSKLILSSPLLEAMMMALIGIFGSAFNPPHFGHLDVIEQGLAYFDKLIVVPARSHAFSKKMISYEHRFALVNQLLRHVSAPERVTNSRVEQELWLQKGEGSIYTFDVLEVLQQRHPADQLRFIIGPDNGVKDVWQKFYRFSDIDRRWGRWQAQERLSIRSSQIRASIQKQENIQEYTPSDIVDYLQQYRFYRDDSSE